MDTKYSYLGKSRILYFLDALSKIKINCAGYRVSSRQALTTHLFSVFLKFYNNEFHNREGV